MKVLITGGTRGIGRAIAEKFKKENYSVWVTGTQRRSDLEFQYSQVDFSDRDSLSLFLEEIVNSDIDVLINNAAINDTKLIEDVDEKSYNQLFDINLKAPILISSAVVEKMKQKNKGWILNIASIMSVVSRERRALYGASKAGLAGLTRTLAIELAPHNILCNTLSPSFTKTEMVTDTLSEDQINTFCESVPLKRLAAPEEIAEYAFFLCSEKNTFLTGQNIVVDGGMTAQ